MGINIENLNSFPDGFKSLIHETTLNRFKQQSQNDTVELAFPENKVEKPLVYAHWMSLIMVANNYFRLVLKAHYNTDEIPLLVPAVFDQRTSKDVIHDYMREFCNLMGGVFKAALEEKQVATGLSLPLVTRGFDEVFLQFNLSAKNMFDQFYIQNNKGKIIFTVHMEIVDESIIDTINSVKSTTNTDEGEIEFL